MPPDVPSVGGIAGDETRENCCHSDVIISSVLMILL